MNVKPHSNYTGYIAERIFQKSKSHIIICTSAGQDFEPEYQDGRLLKYVVMCDEHGTNTQTTNLPDARGFMKFPEFCQECMRGLGVFQEDDSAPGSGSDEEYIAAVAASL